MANEAHSFWKRVDLLAEPRFPWHPRFGARGLGALHLPQGKSSRQAPQDDGLRTAALGSPPAPDLLGLRYGLGCFSRIIFHLSYAGLHLYGFSPLALAPTSVT